MKTSRLTEKKMSRQHFRNTELAILVAYYKFRDYPVAKKIAKSAHISRTTLYRHHQTAANIPRDYEIYLLQSYKKNLKSLRKGRKIPLKKIYLRTLVFIASNREVVILLFKDEQKGIIKKMLEQIKPDVLKEWRIAGNLDKVYNIYANEIIGVIEAWGKQKLSEQSLGQVLNDIMYLTASARQNLLPLSNL